MSNDTLKLVLHGLTHNAKKMCVLFLEGPCKYAAEVVSDPDKADVDFFDNDIAASKALLETHLKKPLHKPIIVQSLWGFNHKNVINLKKPVTVDSMLAALEASRKAISNIKNNPHVSVLPDIDISTAVPQQTHIPLNVHPDTPDDPVKLKISESKQAPAVVQLSNDKKTPQIEELIETECIILFKAIGNIDITNPNQLQDCHYNPAFFYQGAVESAIAKCQEKKRAYMLHSTWNRIILLPESKEVWLDGKEEDIKIFAGIPVNPTQNKQKKLHLTSISPEVAKLEIFRTKGSFQPMDIFLWKLACWTSMGRYPEHINFHKPIQLVRIPNFNRLMLTPYATRITDLLNQEPKSMLNIARRLQINPLFVFLFVSAASSIGLIEQKKDMADHILNSLMFKKRTPPPSS